MKDLQLPVQIFNSHLGLAVVTAIFHLAVTYPRYWYMNQRSVDGKIWRRRGFVLTTEPWSAMTLIWLVIRKCIVLHSISHYHWGTPIIPKWFLVIGYYDSAG